MKRASCVIAGILFVAACSAAPPDPEICDPRPDELGRACSADGECGDWLVCRTGSCSLPEAVAGRGGVELVVVMDGEPVDTVSVEIARSDLSRERGLAHRPCIADGWGLLIEFPDAGDHLITTRAMRFALDVAFAGDDRVVHTLYRNVPAGDDSLYGAAHDVRFVLETPAERVEIVEGATLAF